MLTPHTITSPGAGSDALRSARRKLSSVVLASLNPFRRGLCPAAAAIALTVLAFAGCGGNAALDLAPLGDFLDLQINNNTAQIVTIEDCWGAHCDRSIGSGFKDILRPNGQRYEAAWDNATAGIARVRVLRAGRTFGCFAVPYRKGQMHATVLVSNAAPCNP